MSFKRIKHLVIGSLLTLVVGTVSATEKPKVEEKHEHSAIIDSRALIANDFSGMESKPIVAAFYEWMKETKGDILIFPPVSADAEYFKKMYLTDDGDFIPSDNIQLDMSIVSAGLDPWGDDCSQTFYILRTTSESSIVRAIDSTKDGSTLAFTYPGCFYKFIFVVADRISSEEEMKTVMIHELGHMWGLPDNQKGENSIMNGMYNNMSKCITKEDMKELYELHGASMFLEGDMGCETKKVEPKQKPKNKKGSK